MSLLGIMDLVTKQEIVRMFLTLLIDLVMSVVLFLLVVKLCKDVMRCRVI